MRYFDRVVAIPALALAVWSGQGTAVGAACLVCDEVITLSASQAACLSQSYETWVSEIEGQPDKRAALNFNACRGEAKGLRDRGGVNELPDLPASTAPRLGRSEKSVYLLDKGGLECLKSQLEAQADAIDPSITIDLYQACG